MLSHLYNELMMFLLLLALPQAVISEDHLTVGAGERLMLHCNVTGEPHPQVVWSHNNNVITNSSRTIVSDIHNPGTLSNFQILSISGLLMWTQRIFKTMNWDNQSTLGWATIFSVPQFAHSIIIQPVFPFLLIFALHGMSLLEYCHLLLWLLV